MDPNGPIVCATDLSPGGVRAVDLAARVARDLGAPLRLVHATDVGPVGEPSTWTSPAHEALSQRVQRRTAHLTQLLEAERARAAGIAPSVEAALIDGRAWQAVVEDASRTGARMIVVGPHGQSGPAEVLRASALEWLLGITADRVVRHAPCPVLVAPHTGEMPALAGGSWLVAIDLEPPSREALVLALRLAKAVGARLTALHAIPELPAVRPPQHQTALGEDPALTIDPALEQEAAEARLRAMLDEARAATPGAPEVAMRVVHGDPASAIGDAASEVGATLVVIGTHGRRGLAHALLGSVAERVLRRARQPVLCVRPPTS